MVWSVARKIVELERHSVMWVPHVFHTRSQAPTVHRAETAEACMDGCGCADLQHTSGGHNRVSVPSRLYCCMSIITCEPVSMRVRDTFLESGRLLGRLRK